MDKYYINTVNSIKHETFIDQNKGEKKFSHIRLIFWFAQLFFHHQFHVMDLIFILFW